MMMGGWPIPQQQQQNQHQQQQEQPQANPPIVTPPTAPPQNASGTIPQFVPPFPTVPPFLFPPLPPLIDAQNGT